MYSVQFNYSERDAWTFGEESLRVWSTTHMRNVRFVTCEHIITAIPIVQLIPVSSSNIKSVRILMGSLLLLLLVTRLPLLLLVRSEEVNEESESIPPPHNHQPPPGPDGDQYYSQEGGQGEQEIPLTGPEICALTGYFVLPHPCNCQLFYTWYQGVFVENLCEPGLYFDSLTLNCVGPEEVTCADGFGPPPAAPGEDTSPPTPPPVQNEFCLWAEADSYRNQ